MELLKAFSFLGPAGVAAFVAHLFTKRKQQAEIQNLLGRTYLDIIESMRTEIDRLRNRITDLEIEVKQLKNHTACNPKPFLKKV
jgi:cell division protein FtsB